MIEVGGVPVLPILLQAVVHLFPLVMWLVPQGEAAKVIAVAGATPSCCQSSGNISKAKTARYF